MYDRIVFDVDDTLYRNPEFSGRLTEMTKSWIEDELGVNRDAVEVLYQWLKSEYPNPYDGFSALGLSVEDYFENVFYRVDPEDAIEPRPGLGRTCAETDASVVVVSLAPHEHCERVLDALGLDEHVDAIYNPYQDADAHEKSAVYAPFSEERVLVVGDSYANDLRPGIELGFDAVHVTPECDLSHQHVCLDDVSELGTYLEDGVEDGG